MSLSLDLSLKLEYPDILNLSRSTLKDECRGSYVLDSNEETRKENESSYRG